MSAHPAHRSVQPLTYAAVAICGMVLMAALLYWGVLHTRPATAQDYPIQGFDVSHHQQQIDWHRISPEKYRFVYLKATEGGDFKDRKFQDNWLAAHEQGFLVGAYHFYRLCRDGQVQAQNFIDSVPKQANSLPPVIDLEYDSNCINTYTREQLLHEIGVMHDALQQHYGKQPIFYISRNFYNIVLVNQFPQVPLWVREYQGKPALSGNPDWMFWQYSNRGQITGIATPVDLNAFYGDEQDWQQFLKANQIVEPSKNSVDTTP
ncbi:MULTISPECIES: glycoside hydrolase family 25 protein [Acinetobacter]|uniref:glycoside hydrolase family 25 protein n=1 Tax=Acinetobacter TaxID=469 RepID=UPI0002D0FAA3|nr:MULTISPECIES: GH25 family lysozyme [Acinetobacter]ENW88025.1 hypothetical protein F905_02581 [Acinetobacter sp. CIP 53.82]MBA0154792.1 glycoside hydrolase family 25 protein [Acinetobacter indicus]